MTETAQRLHRLSWLLLMGSSLRRLVWPMLVLLLLASRDPDWVLLAPIAGVALLTVLAFGVWAALCTRSYRYRIGDGELLVRDGVFDRTFRHIPFSRIQHISQRRTGLHRLLGVTELRLESASGGKPEAVMTVLGCEAASALEALLRGGRGLGAPVDALSGQAPPAPDLALYKMGPAEIVRLGLVSNRGMVMVGLVLGAISQSYMLTKEAVALLRPPALWLSRLFMVEVETGHWQIAALSVALGLIVLLALIRLLSVALAFARYHGFVLERHGDKLLARRGLLTHVHAGARLPRLQHWVLEETWLHRRFGRCRLAVGVLGSDDHGKPGLAPDGQLSELAPIATMAQAHALLRVCLPALDWDALDWQPLSRATVRLRLLIQARWLVPLIVTLLLVDRWAAWPVPPLPLVFVCALVAAGVVWHARVWARHAALAEAGGALIYRSGVWRKTWVIVVGARLQSVRLVSSPLERALGLVHLQADTQGERSRHWAIDIACMDRAAGDALRARLWRDLRAPVQTPAHGALQKSPCHSDPGSL